MKSAKFLTRLLSLHAASEVGQIHIRVPVTQRISTKPSISLATSLKLSYPLSDSCWAWSSNALLNFLACRRLTIKIVLSTWLMTVVSFVEPALRGCSLGLGRMDGVAVDVEGAGEERDGCMNPPGSGCDVVKDMDEIYI